MIPKVIHYCWFGSNPKPKLAKKCIKSWKKYCADYEIVEWNENNFDISSAPLYVRQAYEAKKWAFVTDYVRAKVIYDNGGIYLDTDVQIIKPLDEMLEHHAFFGFEGTSYVNTGLGFGAEKNSDILREIICQYEGIPFVLKDGSYDTKTCPKRNTEIFISYGLVQNGKTQKLCNDVVVYSSEYFCPLEYESGKIEKTENTITIHWFNASWLTKDKKKKHIKELKLYRKIERKHYIKNMPNRVIQHILGEVKYDRLKANLKRDTNAND